MDFEFTKEETELKEEVRAFIKQEATPELVAESQRFGSIPGGPEARKFFPKFAAKGWLVPHWPREYCGMGLSEMMSYIIKNEMSYAGIPIYCVEAFNAGPIIIRHGSEEMKKEFLPPISRGEIVFALGYTEPQAGSDLSAINIRAEDKGDYFLLNGMKTFNTHCHFADYHWLAARTSSEGPKHKGISIMIVDFKSPGLSIRPLITMAGTRTNEVYYEDVKVPKKNLVGEKNKGFYYMMEALDFERCFPPGEYLRAFEEITEYAKTTIVNGKPLSKNPLIRQKLAQLEIEFEVANLLYYQLAYLLDSGKVPGYQASMEKLFATEAAQRVANLGMEVLGLYGELRKGSKLAPLSGKVDHLCRHTIAETLYAGTSEIQRNIIAERGLGLPRAK